VLPRQKFHRIRLRLADVQRFGDKTPPPSGDIGGERGHPRA